MASLLWIPGVVSLFYNSSFSDSLSFRRVASFVVALIGVNCARFLPTFDFWIFLSLLLWRTVRFSRFLYFLATPKWESLILVPGLASVRSCFEVFCKWSVCIYFFRVWFSALFRLVVVFFKAGWTWSVLEELKCRVFEKQSRSCSSLLTVSSRCGFPPGNFLLKILYSLIVQVMHLECSLCNVERRSKLDEL